MFKLLGRIDLSAAPFVLAEAAGSIIGDLSGPHSVQAIGRFALSGIEVERAYFGDGKSFVEYALDPARPDAPQIRAYRLLLERFPADAEEWAFFMGSDGANAIAARDAYIGAPAISLDMVGQEYQRVWGDGDAALAPLDIVEEVSAKNARIRREHALMQYARALSSVESAAEYEFLYLGRESDGGGASIKAWVGIDIAPLMLACA